MTDQIQDTVREGEATRRNGKMVAGAALIVLGLLALAAQFVQGDWLELLFLPALATVFLVWGVLARQVGLLIPGGILGGIALGAYLIEGPLAGLEEASSGGVFLLAFSLGWGLITLLSGLVTEKTHWWPLIPGGIMALIGAGLLAGELGQMLLNLAGKAWPLALIAIGLYLLVARRQAAAADEAPGAEPEVR